MIFKNVIFKLGYAETFVYNENKNKNEIYTSDPIFSKYFGSIYAGNAMVF